MSRARHIGGAVSIAGMACLGLVASALGGCERGLEPAICPDIGVGDLAISELRSPSSKSDLLGHWIELYNTTAAPIDLEGLQVLLRNVNGSDEARIIVRSSVTVAGGDYVVLGGFADATRPPHVDYGWYPDFVDTEGNPHRLFLNGAIDVLACGLRIDRITLDDLPDTGSYSLGVTPPDATTNDPLAAWCNDVTADGGAFLPGTPGLANHPCVPPP